MADEVLEQTDIEMSTDSGPLKIANPLIRPKKCDSYEQALTQSYVEANHTFGISMPVQVFRQGHRYNFAAAVPIAIVANRLISDSATKGGKLRETREKTNRPEVPGHAENIRKYLVENLGGSYILPPLTLNVRQPITLYYAEYPGPAQPGVVVLPGTTTLNITDGQHRWKAIKLLLSQLKSSDTEKYEHFANDAVTVMITLESDLSQIHQDFADCSRTKALAPALVAMFDQRNPANRAILTLEQACPLFKGRIDSTSSTLSKKSTYLFLANQIRQLLKELLMGSYQTAEPEFERRAEERLGTQQKMDVAVGAWIAYINYLTTRIPAWSEIAAADATGLRENQIPAKRATYICCTTTGLNVIGRIGNQLLSNGSSWEPFADKLASLDWSRSAEIWQGTIVQNDRVVTAGSPLANAVARVREAIGLPPLDKHSKGRLDPSVPVIPALTQPSEDAPSPIA